MSIDPELHVTLDAGELHLITTDTRHLVADEIGDPGHVLEALRVHELILCGTTDRLFGDYPEPQPVTHTHPEQLLAHLPRLEGLS